MLQGAGRLRRVRQPSAVPPATSTRPRRSRCTRPRARPCWPRYERGYADPRRLHGPGRDARLLLDNARAVVAECLEVRADEVSFTPSGTDAVHRGLLGPAPRPDAAIVHTRRRALRGRARGDLDRVAAVEVRSTAPAGSTAATSSPRRRRRRRRGPAGANHEVGTSSRSPRSAAPLGVPLFVDACASMGRLPLPRGGRRSPAPRTSGAARPASACCVVRKGARWVNPFPGDDRIDERRPASRTCRPRWPPRRPCRPSSPSATRSTPASARSSTGSGPARRRSRTSRSSATRSTGSPTW